MTNFKDKIKRSLTELYIFQDGTNWHQLGRAIDWRIRLLERIQRKVTFDQFAAIASGLIIRQQIENELNFYQEELDALFEQAEQGEIDQDEFEERLENLTIAIMLIAFLSGSNQEDDPRFRLATDQLLDGGTTANVTLEDIDNLEAREQAEISLEAAKKLGDEIGVGLITASQLFSRVALWVTTALGIFNLGILFREDDPFLIWLYSPLKEHCDDCLTLNGQIHLKSEWQEFFRRTGKRPQGRALECGGWHCGCGVFEVEGPSRGNFV